MRLFLTWSSDTTLWEMVNPEERQVVERKRWNTGIPAYKKYICRIGEYEGNQEKKKKERFMEDLENMAT